MLFQIERRVSEHLKGAADVLVGAYARPPWNENWSLEAAVEDITCVLDTPRSIALAAIDRQGARDRIGHTTAAPCRFRKARPASGGIVACLGPNISQQRRQRLSVVKCLYLCASLTFVALDFVG
jgi:hypothetical protein